MKKPLFLLLLPSLLLTPGCDETSDFDPGSSLRRPSYTHVKAKTATVVFGSDGTDNPITGDGVGPDIGPLHELEIAAVIRAADSIYASAFATSEEPEALCPETCAGEGMEWTGEVSAVGEYDVGEIVWTEGEEGMSYHADIYGAVDMNCLCEG